MNSQREKKPKSADSFNTGLFVEAYRADNWLKGIEYKQITHDSWTDRQFCRVPQVSPLLAVPYDLHLGIAALYPKHGLLSIRVAELLLEESQLAVSRTDDAPAGCTTA